MNSNPKKQNIADNDRLSSLPDGILIYILSFIVPTIYAARTSILSKRWRDLFLDVSRIHIEHCKKTLGKTLTSEDEDFLHFVNRITLLGTSSPIEEFRLRCPTFSKTSSIYIWLACLLRRGVKDLEIEQVLSMPLTLGHQLPKPLVVQIHPPTGFFQSKTLVVLKLNGGTFRFDSNESVWFPNLKVLSLQFLILHLKSNILRFADQGYPLLEDLSLTTLEYPNTQTSIEISLHNLKNLTIIDRISPTNIAGIDVDTPHLQRLECRYMGSRLGLRKCETLATAIFTNINLATGFGRTFIETLRMMNNVKFLSLAHMDLAANPEEFRVHVRNSLHHGQFPYLNRLEYIHPTPLSVVSIEFLKVLLYRAPYLSALYANMDHIMPSMPRCFRQNLREIRLVSFKGTDVEVALVEWCLNQGALLQWMILECNKQAVFKVAAVNRLVKIGQLHPKCEIKFIF